MSWRLRNTERVLDTFMKVEKRTYEMPDGQVKDFYIKVGRPTVCVVAITHDNKVITVEQYRPGPDKTFNELPGGYIDEGETPEQAVARELLEETGYSGDFTFVAESYESSYSDRRSACFVATDCVRVGNQHLDDGEFITVRLMKIPDFIAMVRAGQLTDAGAAMLGLDRLGLLGQS